MAGFIDAAVQDIDNRIKELREEEQKLVAARAALTGAVKPRGRRGGNTRSNQALDLVRSQPGITIPQIAESLKIEPNYLYRVMPKLTLDGLVKRDGQGWHAVMAAAPAE
jgi:predicted Rossmann fold nucleotide-binding protein DprA/Smf involved in DNA uptake